MFHRGYVSVQSGRQDNPKSVIFQQFIHFRQFYLHISKYFCIFASGNEFYEQQCAACIFISLDPIYAALLHRRGLEGFRASDATA